MALKDKAYRWIIVEATTNFLLLTTYKMFRRFGP